jgi:hypothetical protein
MNLSELLEKQRKVEERARKLANQSQISRAEDEELDDLLGQNKRLKIQIEEAREGRGSGRSTDFDVAGSAGEIRSAALRTLEASGKHLAPAQLDNVDSLIRSRNENLDGLQIARRVNITESEAYRSAFMKAMTQPKPAFDAAETRAINAFQEFRAMAEGTGSEGGYGVPPMTGSDDATATWHPGPHRPDHHPEQRCSRLARPQDLSDRDDHDRCVERRQRAGRRLAILGRGRGRH